jgi:hypothetical protein
VRRILLDENLPRLLKLELKGFEVRSVVEAGWAGTKNGRLLLLAEREFDVFLTADRNLPHQQTLSSLSLGVVVLAAGSTKLEDLRPLAADIRTAAESIQPGQIVFIPPA